MRLRIFAEESEWLEFVKDSFPKSMIRYLKRQEGPRPCG